MKYSKNIQMRKNFTVFLLAFSEHFPTGCKHNRSSMASHKAQYHPKKWLPWVREDLPVPCPCWNFPCLRPHRLGFQPQVDMENRCPFWCVQAGKKPKGFIWFIIFDYLTIWGYWYNRPFWARVSTEITRISTDSFVSLWQASLKKWQRPCEVGNLAQLHNSLNLDAGKCWQKWNTSFVAFLIWAALRVLFTLT